MPKIESENNSSSSSSSSGSESDSSTSSEQEKTRGKTRYATSNNGEESSLSTTEKIKPESKKTKIKKGNAKTSSSESSSQSSNENGSSSSSSSSSSNSSGSDTEEGEVKIKQPKPIKSRQDEQRAPDKDDSVKTDADALQSESLKEHVPEVPSLVVMPVSEDIDQQTGQETAANKEIYQQEISVEPEVDISKIDCQEIQCPPQMQEDNAPKDSNPSEINKLPEDQESEKTDDTATTKDLIKDGEPDSKKMKLEIIKENPSTASHKPSKETESKKYSNRRDRSRSPIKRDRRRSRDRGDRKRRQRSRTRSRDRRHRRSRSRSRSKDRNRDKSNDRRRKDDNASITATAEQSDTKSNPNEKITERQRRTVDLLTSRTGGAYIPPAKLRMMQAEITDKASAAYQRIAWEALKKSIHGYINKVNVDNIGIITRELLKENIVRGRGLLCRSIIQAQNASPTFTHVYAALVAIINSKFPNIGELLLKRLVIQFKRAFRRNDKAVCLSASRFVAHLVNQRVAHEILALEILTLLVETPTDDSVEVAIAFLKECGMKLTEVSSKGIGAIFEMLKNILHEGKLDKRVQYMIEVVFQVRKDGFKDHQAVIESLELVEEDDQFTHLLMLDEATNTEDNLNAFKFDDMYATNEDKYKGLSKEILGSDASDSDDEDGSESGSDDDSDSEANEEEKAKTEIIDNTETNLIALRRTIYLTINSSLDYEECAHKLMKMQLKPGQEIELCHMFLDCCAEQRTYEKFYGLLAQRFCSINKTYIEPFEEIFKDTYQTTHRLDTNRLRNVSKFFAHLLFTDAIGWDVLDCIKLNEDDTTSSSRIFIKILFQELAEYMGLFKLNEKLKDAVLMETLAGLFPKDNPRNTRFSINFFSSIGLGGLTDDLRQFLKNAPKNVPAINSEFLQDNIKVTSSSSSSSDSSSSSSSSSSSESESSESSSSDDEKSKKNKKNKKKVSKKKASKKVKKTKSKPERKKRKSKKKHQTSESSESIEDSNSSDDDKRSKKKKKYASARVDKKNKNTRTEKSPPRQEIEDREHKKRHAPEERISNNGRSMNGRDCDNDRPNGRTDRRDRDNRGEPSPHRERRRRDERNRDRDREQDRYRGREPDRHPEREHKRERDRDRDYNSRRNSGEYRTSGKSRNGSKERG